MKTEFWMTFKEKCLNVILGAIFSNQSTLGAIFFSNQSTLGTIFACIFGEFAKIFRDLQRFLQILPRFPLIFSEFSEIFHGFFPNQLLWGCACALHPCLLQQWWELLSSGTEWNLNITLLIDTVYFIFVWSEIAFTFVFLRKKTTCYSLGLECMPTFHFSGCKSFFRGFTS